MKLMQGDCLEQMRDIAPNTDPFAGSGSTAVACVNTGRDFIGMELDQGYFETAQRRVKEAQEGRGERGPAG